MKWSDDDDDARRKYYGMYMFVYVATKSTNFDFLRQQDTLSQNIIEVNEKKRPGK